MIEEIPTYEQWKPLISRVANPEGVWKCSNCNREVLLHPNYVKENVSGCAGHGRCNKLEDQVKIMIAFRGWTYIKLETGGKNPKIHFKCKYDHEVSLTFESLRKGSGCKKCNIEASKRLKPERVPLVRPDCTCVGSQACYRPHACPHHNHGICKYGGAIEWDAKLNGVITPFNVSPSSNQNFWYRCFNEWCGMPYEQRPNNRYKGERCPYCSYNRVCEWNCFQTNYPELCLELVKDWPIKPDTIVAGSNVKLLWACLKHGQTPFTWEASPASRTGSKSMCPKCVRVGFDQKYGGHDFFVKEVSIIHSDKYSYPEEYKGSHIPINIYCPVINRDTGRVHGNFLKTPSHHKRGQGCPICSSLLRDSKLIRQIQEILDQFGYFVNGGAIAEKSFPDLRHIQPLYIDRFVPELKLAIEGDGGYHFGADNDRGGKDSLKLSQLRDMIKDNYCLDNKINLIRIPYTITPNIQFFIEAIDLIRKGEQIYATYDHYYKETTANRDMSKVYVSIMSCPM